MLKLISSVVKTTTAVVVMLLAVTTASAQEGTEKIALTQTDKMKAELKLNDEQYNKVLNINKEYADKIAVLRTDETDRAKKGAAIKTLKQDREDKLKAVLTDVQYTTYLTKREESRKKSIESFSKAGKQNLQAAPIKQ